MEKRLKSRNWLQLKLWDDGEKQVHHLFLCPDKDDRELGFDDKRNNNFDYEKMDPHGYACPVSITYQKNECKR